MFALFLTWPSPAQALKCYERILPNGLKVVVCPDPALTLCSVDVWVRAGSAFEPAGQSGVAHCLEHVIFKGTPTRPDGKVDEEIENVGATLNGSTSMDWAHFYTTVATEYLDTALDVLSDALQHPAFTADGLRRERTVIMAEVQGRRLDPTQVLDDALARALYGDHPYGHPVCGTPEGIQSINVEALKAFHRAHYVGGAMTLVLVGNVEPEDAFKRAAAHFSSVPDGNAPDWPAVPAKPAAAAPVDLPKALGGTEWLGLGFMGPGMDSPKDVWAADVLISCLSRKESGLIYQRLVTTDKLALGVDTGFLTKKLPSMISITAFCTPGNLDKATAAIREEIVRVQTDGVPEAELAAARRYLLGTYAFEVETASGQSGSLGFYSVLGDVQQSVDYAKNVTGVTGDDVQRVARKYLSPDSAVVVRLSK